MRENSRDVAHMTQMGGKHLARQQGLLVSPDPLESWLVGDSIRRVLNEMEPGSQGCNIHTFGTDYRWCNDFCKIRNWHNILWHHVCMLYLILGKNWGYMFRERVPVTFGAWKVSVVSNWGVHMSQVMQRWRRKRHPGIAASWSHGDPEWYEAGDFFSAMWMVLG